MIIAVKKFEDTTGVIISLNRRTENRSD
jgi:hypothetical protein